MDQEISIDQRHMRMRNRIAGSVIALLGAFVALESLSYNLGSVMRMGPGFLPLALGIIMIGFGILTLFVDDTDEGKAPRIAWRPLVLVLSAILGFALLLEPVGLAAATAALVFLAGFADPGHTWKSMIVLYLILLAGVYIIFAKLLGIPFHIVSGVF
jgi:hypothetical protein